MSLYKLMLLEQYGYSLHVEGEGGERFVELFQRCWEAIPFDERQIILDHWEQKILPQGPLFELSNLWADSEHSYAQVRGSGYQLRFNREAFVELPEQVAGFIIAHELAHVYRIADRRPPNEKEEVREAEADGIAERWGFDKVPLNVFRALVESDGFGNACKKM